MPEGAGQPIRAEQPQEVDGRDWSGRCGRARSVPTLSDDGRPAGCGGARVLGRGAGLRRRLGECESDGQLGRTWGMITSFRDTSTAQDGHDIWIASFDDSSDQDRGHNHECGIDTGIDINHHYDDDNGDRNNTDRLFTYIGDVSAPQAGVDSTAGAKSEPGSAERIFDSDSFGHGAPTDQTKHRQTANGKEDGGDPPPPYSDGTCPITSFIFTMSGPNTPSLITQVQQSSGGFAGLDAGDGDEVYSLVLRQTEFTLAREELLTLPEFILLSFFPGGFNPDIECRRPDGVYQFNIDYDPHALEFLLNFFRQVANSIQRDGSEPNLIPSPAGSVGILSPGHAGIIVLREDLDFYVIPPGRSTGPVEMQRIRHAAAAMLLKQKGIFSGLRKSAEPGSTEQHLIEMLAAGGFSRDAGWEYRDREPNKAAICSLALARLRANGDTPEQTGMAQKLLLFWRKPARRCWWEGVNLEGIDGLDGPLKVWTRRVWTLEITVIGLR